MNFYNWSDASLAYRGIRGYRTNATMGTGDYYYWGSSDPAFSSYNNYFSMSLHAFIPQSIGAYSPFMMVEQENTVGSKLIGILITPSGPNFMINIFTGVTTSDGNPGYTVGNSYTDGRTHILGKYYGISIFFNTTTGNKGNSLIRVNNSSAVINNISSANAPTVFTSYRFLNPGTPAGFTLVHSLLSLDTAITQTNYWFMQTNTMPHFREPSRHFSTGEKRVFVIDNGTSFIQNYATKEPFVQKKAGINPIPIDYVDIEFNVNA